MPLAPSQHFNQSAQCYDQVSSLQRIVARQLVRGIEQRVLAGLQRPPLRILDVGCGTGFLTREIATCFPEAKVVGIDAAPNMVQVAHELLLSDPSSASLSSRLLFCDLDFDAVEKILRLDDVRVFLQPYAEFDLIVSNFALHWATALDDVLSACCSLLSEEAWIEIALPVRGSFWEIEQSWKGLDQATHIATFPEPNCFMRFCRASHGLFRIVQSNIMMRNFSKEYSTIVALRNDLACLGGARTQSAPQLGLVSRRRWQLFCEAFARFKTSRHGFPTTYKVSFVSLEVSKKNK